MRIIDRSALYAGLHLALPVGLAALAIAPAAAAGQRSVPARGMSGAPVLASYAVGARARLRSPT